MNRMLPRHWSLMTKLPLTITLMVFASALTIGLVVIARDGARQTARLETQTLALARAVAAAGQDALLNRDTWALYRTLDQLIERQQAASGDTPVVDAAFLDAEGVVMAHTDAAAHPIGLPLIAQGPLASRQISYALGAAQATLYPAELRDPGMVHAVVPLRVDETDVGYLVLRSSMQPMQAQLRKDSWLVLAFSIGLALVTSTLGILISRRMVSPLRDLANGLAAVSQGGRAEVREVPLIDRDEIGLLAERFNRMVSELERNTRLEQDLANAEKLAGLGRFAAGLAHEVNNPLGGMKNCVNMLRHRPDDADLVRKYLPMIDTGLDRISATIQALLGELRGESNAHPCRMGCLVDLEALIRAEIAERPIALTWNVEPQVLMGVSISCTCPHVHQIIMNLSRNAIAVMPEGGSLNVSARRRGGELVLEVADSGPGLDAAAQRRLFEPFYTTSRQGTGLGLWITYTLIQRMGGNITVDSAPGKGARFTVTLPTVPPFKVPQKESERAA
jgi:signal transduction histidine kinase